MKKWSTYRWGGDIYEDSQYNEYRCQTREHYKIGNKLLYLHAGKLNKAKKTLEIVNSFNRINDKNKYLLIAGSLADEIKEEFFSIINLSSNIKFIGWQSTKDLDRLLCASDVYIQPGTQSVIMQQAACSRNALILYPHKSHRLLFGDSVIYVKGEEEIFKEINNISFTRIKDISKTIEEIARNKLDYVSISEKILIDTQTHK